MINKLNILSQRNSNQRNSNNLTNENARDKSVVQLKSIPLNQAQDLADKLERQRAEELKRQHAQKLERQNRISVAAYYRAARRGFEGGYELQDWLEAEAEIDGILQPEGVDRKSS